jgi:hypothetical protein
LDSAKKVPESIRTTFVLQLIWFSEVFFRRKWLECLKIHQKITFFRFFAKIINFFLITAQFFFRFMTHIPIKKNHFAEYDIVGMVAENFVEVGYVWWVDSGKILFFSNSSKKYSTLKLPIVSTNNFCSTSF